MRDALFDFCHAMEGRSFASFGETVNISALIAAAGALHHMHGRLAPLSMLWQRAKDNALTLAAWLSESSWKPLLREASLQTGILLLKHSAPTCGEVGPQLRRHLAEQGVVVSAFRDGLLRFSMPSCDLTLQQMSTISRALGRLGV